MTAVGPLSGLVVADFSRVLAGPYCTMLLGDLGAEVIKVESPTGDDTRTWMPPTRNGVSTYYLGVNRNKRSVVLDLKDPAQLELAQTLASRADIVVENFMPGTARSYGLDFDSVRETNPGVVYASISGFGNGDGAAIPGYDLMVQALSGVMSLTGDADGTAYRAGISVVDVITGLHAAMGILAALQGRASTGEGQRIEVSLLTSILSGLVNHGSSFVAGGVVPYRMGNAHPSLYPYDPFPTQDGQLVVIAGNDRQFAKLCTALGVPALATDPRFATNADRTRNREQLEPLLTAQLRQRSSEDWFRLLLDAGVPCAPIQTLDAGVALAERLGLDPVVEAGGEVPVIRHPVTFSDSTISYGQAPPSLDEHGEEIRTWLRGPKA